jgi:cytidylate kinase
MGLITVSGQPGCRTEEVARIAAQMLAFELVTESRLGEIIPEEFGIAGAIPDRAWLNLMLAVTGPLATRYHLVLCFDGAELLASEFPGALRVRIVAPDSVRTGNLMLDRRLDRGPARDYMAELDRERKAEWKKRFGRVSLGPDAYDLVLNTGTLSAECAAQLIQAAAQACGIEEKGLLPASEASHLEFLVRLRLARHGITPVARIELASPKPFVNASEEIFANLLDFYRIAWEYEPKSFPIQWDKDGHVSEAFTPDFYLPEFDLYVELTTMKQAHVTKKNRKVKLLREIYPHVNVQVFYQKDFENLMFKYGLVRDAAGDGQPR